MTHRQSERGFILPLAVLLVLVLSISGMGFLQLDFLERKMTLNNVDNHGAFYVANAGIERAREVFKINTSGLPSWTPILTGATPGYTIENPADPLLCPDPTKNCIIPPFDATVIAPSIPFDSAFFQGSYRVRAFNDSALGETGAVDLNGILIFRALGNVRGEQKLLEATIQAVSGVNLINCASGTGCPNKISGIANTIDAMEGREPAVGPIPLLNKQDKGFYPLTESGNYYRDETGTKFATNLPGLVSSYQQVTPPKKNQSITLTPKAQTYYFATGDVKLVQGVKGVAVSNVVIFSTGTITIPGDMVLTNTILVGVNGVTLQSGPTLSAPASPFPNYPLIISGTDVSQGGNQSDGSFTGNIYAVGTVSLNPQYFEGAIFGNEVDVQGKTTYTDQEKLRYYALMPGFYYPNELKTTVLVPGGSSWRELQ